MISFSSANSACSPTALDCVFDVSNQGGHARDMVFPFKHLQFDQDKSAIAVRGIGLYIPSKNWQ
jgi:hypothetical protein